jgi:ferrous iron transport protein A
VLANPKGTVKRYVDAELSAVRKNFGRSTKMQTLRTIQPGATVRVVKIAGVGPTKRRIMDMGLVKGVEIFVRKVAPLGDPLEITVRGYELSLRKADADLIEVE